MKKQISYLLTVLCLLAASKTFANDLLPANVRAEFERQGSGGMYNTLDDLNSKHYQIDKSYIQSFDDVTKDEQIYDASIEENLQREGMIYNPHFLLQKINFEGNTKISSDELEKLGLEVLGEDVYFDELLEVCQKVTNLYRAKGYLTSYATVPPQRIVDGVATIKIVESKVGELNIEGEKWTREWYLKHIIMGKA